jgi:ribonuclease III
VVTKIALSRASKFVNTKSHQYKAPALQEMDAIRNTKHPLRSRGESPGEMTITPPEVVSPLPPLPAISPELERQVLTHSSAVSTSSRVANDRLATLGDAYLTAAVTRILYDSPLCLKPGDINDTRRHFVSREMICNLGRAYHLHDKAEVSPNLPRSEEFIGNLAVSCFKAYLAAFAMETSVEELTKFIFKLMEPSLEQLAPAPEVTFSIQDFHERLTKLKMPLPEYPAEEMRRDNQPEFQVRCVLLGNTVGTGTGRTKQMARRLAAEEANRQPDRKFKSILLRDNKSK